MHIPTPFAVIGASNNSEKYGYKVFKNLLDGGKPVVPINPKGGQLLGKTVYPSLPQAFAAGHQIKTVIFVVPPTASKEILPTLKDLGIELVWFQPGSADDAVITSCEREGLVCIHDACIMKV